jgi:hypothetical protein
VPRSGTITVVVETGKRRVFASAVDWPGWCRSGPGEQLALENLARYAARYAPVVRSAGSRLPGSADDPEVFEVVERLAGSATTDFGAPGAPASAEAADLSPKEAARRSDLVVASWAEFDRVVAGAPPVLRKGPRGGGRDRDAISEHVMDAEGAYARKLGVVDKAPPASDRRAVMEFRAALESVLRSARGGAPTKTNAWSPRYAARRIAWHVLDHAWEIEDKSEP